MLVMFALGMTQLTWMLGLTLLMFVEKVSRGGELIGRVSAPAFFVFSILIILTEGAVT
jgi:predicted metal-binding membrane protein